MEDFAFRRQNIGISPKLRGLTATKVETEPLNLENKDLRNVPRSGSNHAQDAAPGNQKTDSIYTWKHVGFTDQELSQPGILLAKDGDITEATRFDQARKNISPTKSVFKVLKWWLNHIKPIVHQSRPGIELVRHRKKSSLTTWMTI